MTSMKKSIEKKVVESLKNQKPTCGDCIGFNCEIVRDKSLCEKRGIIATSKPCKQFVPDTDAVRPLVEDEDTFIGLSRMVANVDDGQLRKLGALIMREKQTRAAGYHMGQKVYVRYRGLARANYLSNFMSAYIMYADRNVVKIASRNGKIGMTFAGRARDAVLSPEEFEPLRDKMIKRGKYADPEVQKQVSKHLRCLEEYELGLTDQIDKGEIPTIDKVFKSNKVKQKKGTNDLVSIVNAIESGYEIAGESKKSKKKSKSKSKQKGGVTHIDVS